MAHISRTFVYVDGFNLYYGALNGTPFRWLDIVRLCQLMLPGDAVVRVRYFTARIKARGTDDSDRQRQEIYLRALRTCPEIDIQYGHFMSHEIWMPLANPALGQRPFVRVIKTEEKGSDVNLATALLSDAYEGRFDTAVVVSNDSDLLAPIKLVRTRLELPTGILSPNRKPAAVLRAEASFVKPIRDGVLRASQFPPVLTDRAGDFRKPRGW